MLHKRWLSLSFTLKLRIAVDERCLLFVLVDDSDFDNLIKELEKH